MKVWVQFTATGIPAVFFFDPHPDAELVELDEGAIGEDISEFLVKHRRADSETWVLRDPVIVPDPTPEEIAAALAAAEAERAEADIRARKLIGVEFDGVMCSATSQDQSGLTAVLLLIQMQSVAFKPTRFEFENGARLVISLSNYKAFADTWIPFRQSFFRPAG